MKKSITLIALIITIIVLLILAGVSISLVVGDNGIATKAAKANKDTNSLSELEKVNLAIASAEVNKTETTDGVLTTELVNNGLKE